MISQMTRYNHTCLQRQTSCFIRIVLSVLGLVAAPSTPLVQSACITVPLSASSVIILCAWLQGIKGVRFKRVIMDESAEDRSPNPPVEEQFKRLVLCSGKVSLYPPCLDCMA